MSFADKTPRVRGRFAPTPSGRMHLGNAFSALMAWLSARSAGGGMVMRVEDLDPRAQSRERAELLIVSPEARGLGIGRKLFDAVRDHLRGRGAAGFYLLTDDNCDVSFYDHMGLRQEVRRRSEVTWPDEEPGTDFGIYVYAERL